MKRCGQVGEIAGIGSEDGVGRQDLLELLQRDGQIQRAFVARRLRLRLARRA